MNCSEYWQLLYNTLRKCSPGLRTVPSGTVTSSMNSALFTHLPFCGSDSFRKLCTHFETQICRSLSSCSIDTESFTGAKALTSKASRPEHEIGKINMQIKTAKKRCFFIFYVIPFFEEVFFSVEHTKSDGFRIIYGTRL